MIMEHVPTSFPMLATLSLAVCGDFWATEDWSTVHVLPLFEMTRHDVETVLPLVKEAATRAKKTRGEYVSDGVNPPTVLRIRSPDSDARIESAVSLGAKTGLARTFQSGNTVFVIHPHSAMSDER